MIRKTILALTTAGLSSFSISAFATTPSPASTDSVATTIPLNSRGKIKKACRHNDFEGLRLNDAQRASLYKIATTRDSTLKANMLRLKAQRKKMRRACDSSQSASRSLYLKGIKDVLTPEQYMTFLENSYVNSYSRARVHMKHKSAKGPKTRHNRKAHRTHKS